MRFFLMGLIIFFFTACAHLPTFEQRKATAINLSTGKTLSQKDIKTSTFQLFSLQKLSNLCENKDMSVYIEGDGLAWVTRTRISDDPTPINPVGLTLMLSDDSKCKVYLARPCQYEKQTICENKYWTSHRFNTKIIQSYNEALDKLKQNHKNSTFTLVGYSGGGAVATLLSSQREDVKKLITVAGNLDTNRWVKLHHILSLKGSLNPADFTKKLEKIPQYHLIGDDDTIIPKKIFFSYLSKFQDKEHIKYKIYHATHHCCWDKIYKDFLQNQKIQ